MTDGTNIQHKQARESYLRKIANLQKKYPNVPREVVEDSIGSGNNPNQHFKKLKAGLTRKNVARGVGKGAKFVAGKSVLPIAVLQFLQGSPAGAGSDVVSDADIEHLKELRASQIHSGEYADAFPQRKSRGGKVKKKKKKTRSKPNKIMVGYTAGGKV
jgi:hypothetical protein